MEHVINGLKHRARVLHRAAAAKEASALGRVRALRELRSLDDDAIARSVQRRHALAVVARELGFEGWSHLTSVLFADGPVADFGELLNLGVGPAHWNVWSASYDEARAIREAHGGYLLAYRHQFLIVDRHYIETMGLDPDDPDWEALGRDWVRPSDADARRRLYKKRIDAMLAS